METKWTNGPWVRDDGGGIKVAGTEHYVNHSSAWREGAWDDSHATEVSRANDHLMAAAPELYEALENFEIKGPDDDGLVWLVMHGRGTTGKGTVNLGPATLLVSQVALALEADRRSALAKARGES